MLTPKRRLTDLLGTEEETGGVDLGGAAAGAIDTGELSTEDLGALAGEGTDMVDQDQFEVDELEQMLQDPGLDPQQRAEIQQRLALAARRRMAGVDQGI